MRRIDATSTARSSASSRRPTPTQTRTPNTFGGGWRVPKSNPFTAESNATTPVPGWQDNWVDEIYAYGFRNPFRIGFDQLTGDLYAADVGQDRNTFSREEVDKIVKGGNYGWVIKSGTERNTNSGINASPSRPTPISSIRSRNTRRRKTVPVVWRSSAALSIAAAFCPD